METNEKRQDQNSTQTQQNDSEIKKLKRQKITRNVTIVTLIIIIILLLLRGCGHDTGISIIDENVPTFNFIDVDENVGDRAPDKSQEEIQEELNQMVMDSMITISMNSNPVFEDGTSAGNLKIYNDPKNTHNQVVEIFLKETGEQIYQSGQIPVGKSIESAPLSVDLPAGEYDCIAYFHNVNEIGQSLGKAGAEIRITVLN